MCEGNNSSQASATGGPCVVDPGRYIVINHTTGERFENITTDETPDTIDSIVVSSGRISWPDDGWYQVQNADSYATVCEGGLGCNVSAGNYIVINHSTGERFDGITVGDEDFGDSSDDPTPQSTTVVVDGNTILMPNDGWYQVQDATTFATLCEGTLSCDLPIGFYHVINHTTSQRWDNLEVGAQSTDDTEPESEPQPETGDTQMTFLAPYGEPPYGNLPVVDYAPWFAPTSYTLPEGTFADDCMIESLGINYCYQSATRQLSATLSNGDPYWAFALPGYNSTNRIDGMRLTNNSELTIVATTTQEFGYPTHELSRFTSQGEFLDTVDLFQIGGVTWPMVNIQGEPLIVDKILQPLGFGAYNLQITANMYELVEGGNRSVPTDWFQTGVIEAIVSPTGAYEAIEICRDATVLVPSLGKSGLPDCVRTTDGLGSQISTLNAIATANTGSGFFNLFADQIEDAKNVVPELGISTDLLCLDNLSDTSCLTDQLPIVGATIVSSSPTVACSTDSWDAGYTGTATAQLTQRLIRTTEFQAELHDEFTFAHRCPIPDSDGVVLYVGNRLTGNATLVSTIDLSSGEIISSETRFYDLTSIRGTTFLRFYDGTYGDSISATGYLLTANTIEDGRIGCSRSCSPSAYTIGEYQNFFLRINLNRTDENGDNRNDHNIYYDYANYALAETTSHSSWVQFLSTNNTISEDEGITGRADYITNDGSHFRLEPGFDSNFPSMTAVAYTRIALSLSDQEQLILPIQALTQNIITVLD